MFKSQSARDACAGSYGDEGYWRYLDEHAAELHTYYLARNDADQAERMLTQSLSEALMGNDGV